MHKELGMHIACAETSNHVFVHMHMQTAQGGFNLHPDTRMSCRYLAAPSPPYSPARLQAVQKSPDTEARCYAQYVLHMC